MSKPKATTSHRSGLHLILLEIVSARKNGISLVGRGGIRPPLRSLPRFKGVHPNWICLLPKHWKHVNQTAPGALSPPLGSSSRWLLSLASPPHVYVRRLLARRLPWHRPREHIRFQDLHLSMGNFKEYLYTSPTLSDSTPYCSGMYCSTQESRLLSARFTFWHARDNSRLHPTTIGVYARVNCSTITTVKHR